MYLNSLLTNLLKKKLQNEVYIFQYYIKYILKEIYINYNYLFYFYHQFKSLKSVTNKIIGKVNKLN